MAHSSRTSDNPGSREIRIKVPDLASNQLWYLVMLGGLGKSSVGRNALYINYQTTCGAVTIRLSEAKTRPFVPSKSYLPVTAAQFLQRIEWAEKHHISQNTEWEREDRAEIEWTAPDGNRLTFICRDADFPKFDRDWDAAEMEDSLTVSL
jgi:hypothetical protein